MNLRYRTDEQARTDFFNQYLDDEEFNPELMNLKWLEDLKIYVDIDEEEFTDLEIVQILFELNKHTFLTYWDILPYTNYELGEEEFTEWINSKNVIMMIFIGLKYKKGYKWLK